MKSNLIFHFRFSSSQSSRHHQFPIDLILIYRKRSERCSFHSVDVWRSRAVIIDGKNPMESAAGGVEQKKSINQFVKKYESRIPTNYVKQFLHHGWCSTAGSYAIVTVEWSVKKWRKNNFIKLIFHILARLRSLNSM